VDFTSINDTIIIEVTVFSHNFIMFRIDVIFWGDSIISIRVVVSDAIERDSFNIITIPSTWTLLTFEWSWTESLSVFWAIFSSPLVFTSNDAFVEFTSINRSGIIGVTVVIEGG
jgi:hypothetical protein